MSLRWRLFPKYATLIVSLVGGMVIASGGFSLYFSYLENQQHLNTLQREKAKGAALQIEQYILDIENKLGWSTLPQLKTGVSPTEERRFEYLKLLRQSPAITEVAWIDVDGRERLKVSRLAMDVSGTDVDLSRDPKFLNATSGKTWYGPVYFRNDTEPYMTISRPIGGRGGVVVVEVNLKFVGEVVSRISIGEAGLAFVVNSANILIAHPDISLVLQKTDMTRLAQVAALRNSSQDDGSTAIGPDLKGIEVLTAYARVPTLNWTVFVELPLAEAFQPVYESIRRLSLLLLAALAISMLASFFLARLMVRPINALQKAAVQIAAGNLEQTITVSTGDELESLAGEFNHMAVQLKESYAGLERKVEERTADLAREQIRTKQLLHNILPVDLAEELSATGHASAASYEAVSILFADLSGFTQAASVMPADRMVAELNEIFAAFDDICDELGIEKIKTIGDAFMAAAGLPKPCSDHAQRCVRGGLLMIHFLEQRNQNSAFKWSLRVGIHSGPVVAGVVGKRKFAFDIWGDTVNIASRMESSGEVGRVNISAYTFDLAMSEFECVYRGKVNAKGKGDIDMYFVEGLAHK